MTTTNFRLSTCHLYCVDRKQSQPRVSDSRQISVSCDNSSTDYIFYSTTKIPLEQNSLVHQGIYTRAPFAWNLLVHSRCFFFFAESVWNHTQKILCIILLLTQHVTESVSNWLPWQENIRFFAMTLHVLFSLRMQWFLQEIKGCMDVINLLQLDLPRDIEQTCVFTLLYQLEGDSFSQASCLRCIDVMNMMKGNRYYKNYTDMD